MTIAEHLRSIMDRMMSRNFKANDAVGSLGELTEQRGKRWRLAPNRDENAIIELRFEDLKAGQNLLTSIKFGFEPTWQVQADELNSVFGPSSRTMPRTGPKGDKILAFDLDGHELPGIITVKYDYRTPSEQPLAVKEVRLRRIFPVKAGDS